MGGAAVFICLCGAGGGMRMAERGGLSEEEDCGEGFFFLAPGHVCGGGCQVKEDPRRRRRWGRRASRLPPRWLLLFTPAPPSEAAAAAAAALAAY